ncbi:hypothetical protein [Chryseobacterium sp. ISL-6]|uniref:hypothetical protein n=1 Tax=Chryseobacterium sp. ISL-6 TaxID=2819143 RepID=UPI001BE87206|nr:hypothetical protein [Chryseobacterium sp. ISL-6]MBT2621951.1 hypothetical protein [Chryseobacterium sp. ISL-6]
MTTNWTEKAQVVLSHFFKRLADDVRILPIHLGLIMALLYYHNGEEFIDDFHASRRKLMNFSGIRSVNTYHKYLSELVKYGYIAYIPSWHPKKASRFRFI